jgi:hypothetical protein
MFQQSIKVSLIAVIVEQFDLPFAHQVLCLVISDNNPPETPLSTWKTVTELFQTSTKTDVVEGLG